jgi:hypothetical protein
MAWANIMSKPKHTPGPWIARMHGTNDGFYQEIVDKRTLKTRIARVDVDMYNGESNKT